MSMATTDMRSVTSLAHTEATADVQQPRAIGGSQDGRDQLDHHHWRDMAMEGWATRYAAISVAKVLRSLKRLEAAGRVKRDTHDLPRGHQYIWNVVKT
jgi:hypothetical protein